MSMKRRTKFHWRHFYLFSVALGTLSVSWLAVVDWPAISAALHFSERAAALVWASGVIGWGPIIAVLIFLEGRTGSAGRKSLARTLLDLGIFAPLFVARVLASAILGSCVGYLNRYFSVGVFTFTPTDNLLGLVAGLFVWYLVLDFFYYWFHRCQHESPVLWQLHKLHHMDAQLSATTVIRNHWLEPLLKIPSILLPTALLVRFDAATGGLLGSWLAVTFVFQQVLIHSDVRLGIGRLSPLIVSPQTHRIHHSRLPEHHHKNYATYFPVWDILFGTYHAPRRGEYPPTGVDDEPDVESVSEAWSLPFLGWSRMFRDWRSRP
jgi:sterol desaturase/sphingolipid hydroxylase (fatty acid hydroxylase superfamily)